MNLCSQKDLKGAMPVPGPTMITGSSEFCGRWNVGALKVREGVRDGV